MVGLFFATFGVNHTWTTNAFRRVNRLLEILDSVDRAIPNHFDQRLTKGSFLIPPGRHQF